MNSEFQETNVTETVESSTPETTSFLSSFSDKELKNHSSLRDFKDVESLAKSYVNAQKLIGADKIILPKDDSPESWEQVYNKLGRPESPDNYEIKIPEQVKEGMFFDNELIGEFKTKVHQLGLSKKQAEELYNWHTQKMEGKADLFNQTFQQQQEKVVEDLKKTWGNNYENEVAKAKSVIDKFSTPDFKEYLDSTGLGNDLNLIKFMNNVAKSIGEDSFEVNNSSNNSFSATPEAAKQEINKIRGNKENVAILMNKHHPQYKDLNNTLKQLYAVAYPDEK
jgi:hypothetical protein